MPEIATWFVAGASAVVYVIAGVVLGNAGYGDDTEAPAAWMTFAGTAVTVTIVPAIILTGVRYLVPALRGVRAGESETGHGEQRGGDVEHVSANVDAEDAEKHE